MKYVRKMHLHDQPYETPGSNIGQTELGEWVKVVDYQEIVALRHKCLRYEEALRDIVWRGPVLGKLTAANGLRMLRKKKLKEST